MKTLVLVATAWLAGCTSVHTLRLPVVSAARVEVVATPVQVAPAHRSKARAVELPDSSWRVLEAHDRGKRLESNSELCAGEDRRTGGRFVFVRYTVTNRTNEPTMALSVPKITDARGGQFGPVDMEVCYVPSTAKPLGLSTLEPGVTEEFWTVIEVPADAHNLRFSVVALGFALDGPTGEVAIDVTRDGRADE